MTNLELPVENQVVEQVLWGQNWGGVGAEVGLSFTQVLKVGSWSGCCEDYTLKLDGCLMIFWVEDFSRQKPEIEEEEKMIVYYVFPEVGDLK